MKTQKSTRFFIITGALLLVAVLIVAGFSIASAQTLSGDIIHACVNPTTGEVRILPSWKRCSVPFTSTLDWGSGGSGAIFSGNLFYFPFEQEMTLSRFGVNDWFIWMMMYSGGGFEDEQELIDFLPEILVPRSGTLDKLMIKLYFPEFEDDGYCGDMPCPPLIFTVLKNGAATELSCTILYPVSTCSDSGSVVLAAGDLLVIEVQGEIPVLGKFSINIR